MTVDVTLRAAQAEVPTPADLGLVSRSLRSYFVANAVNGVFCDVVTSMIPSDLKNKRKWPLVCLLLLLGEILGCTASKARGAGGQSTIGLRRTSNSVHLPPTSTTQQGMPQKPLGSTTAAVTPIAEPAAIRTIREERQVTVDGTTENWRIEWRMTPLLACLRGDCSCTNLTYAQRGQADLIRARDGHDLETFPLASIYQSGLDLSERGEDEALLPAWPAETGDQNIADDGELAELAQLRKPVSLMDLQDYDHDGRATEFILPVGGVGCAFHGSVAVGISKRQPELHVLGTAMHPEAPLVLSSRGWLLLRAPGKGRYVDFDCGFRGGETQMEVELRTDSIGIHVTRTEYACPRRTWRLLSRVEE